MPVDDLGADALDLVGAVLVVEDDVGVGLHAGRLDGRDCREELLSRAVLRAAGPLLIELAQVEQVVDAVADVELTLSLVGRREPHGREARVRQPLCVGGELAPQRAVRRQVPLERLEDDSVD